MSHINESILKKTTVNINKESNLGGSWKQTR